MQPGARLLCGWADEPRHEDGRRWAAYRDPREAGTGWAPGQPT